MDKKVIVLIFAVGEAITFGVLAWMLPNVADDLAVILPDKIAEIKPQLEFAAIVALAGSIALPSLAGIDTIKELQRRKAEIQNLQSEVRDIKNNQGYYDWQPEDLK